MDHQDFYCLSGEASCFIATCFTSFPKKKKQPKTNKQNCLGIASEHRKRLF